MMFDGAGQLLDGWRVENGDDRQLNLQALLDLGEEPDGQQRLAGSRELLSRATRHRRMLGGAMRQAGVLAAAGLYALDHNIERLAEDHANARRIADRLATSSKVELNLSSAQTNILVFRLGPTAPDAATVVDRARQRGVLIFAFGPRTVRAVTHLDVSAAQCARAAEILLETVER